MEKNKKSFKLNRHIILPMIALVLFGAIFCMGTFGPEDAVTSDFVGYSEEDINRFAEEAKERVEQKGNENASRLVPDDAPDHIYDIAGYNEYMRNKIANRTPEERAAMADANLNAMLDASENKETEVSDDVSETDVSEDSEASEAN